MRLRIMNLYEKISILGPSAKYDTCGPKDFGETTDIPGVYHAKVGGSHVCRLFKVLQTNECNHNCNYCAFRKDRDTKRTVLNSNEMAKAFDKVYRKRLVDGLFLSSGIDSSPDNTMQRLIDTADILRGRMGYRGYLHLKIMPGVSESAIDQALNLSDRVSVNVEGANEEALKTSSPTKSLRNLLFPTLQTLDRKIKRLKELRHYGKRVKIPSVTTQLVVGAGNETDKEIIKMSNLLYKNFDLSRVFYSGFRPVKGTPLENNSAVSISREHRLYQSDFLMRFYKFDVSDIPVDNNGFLLSDIDPKQLWADNNPNFYPVNLNKADYWDLLKVPGIGPKSAEKIVSRRRSSRIMFLEQLKGMRLQLSKMQQYVVL